jgi:tellurium resistance protein TerD
VCHGGDVRAPGEMEKIVVKWHPDIASVAVSSYSALENGFGSFRKYGVFVRITNGPQVVEIPAASASAKWFSYTLCFGEILFGRNPGELEVVNLEMYSWFSSEKRVGYKGDMVVMDIGPEGKRK